ncbi:unnamed protein product [Miscanthus lutarioriparius]|uniref:DUF4283 domain-containing protein n=1 Tax=Miscanthus lutarioriparius TaxID=422564 RepID=A0A811R9P3_9POAL|nr:unnamed protein product [Miscanthus lutarioriparius]
MSPLGTPPPPGHHSCRPGLEIVVIPRSVELQAADDALSSLALVALVGGSRPTVTIADVRHQLTLFYRIPDDAFSISCYAPEDFLVKFNSRHDLEDVLRGPVPIGTPFFLVWKRWWRQSRASAGALKYKVLVGLSGLPAHVQRILGSSCAKLEEAPVTTTGEDRREYVVAGWCVHPTSSPWRR